MAKIIKKESFERQQSLEERMAHLSHEVHAEEAKQLLRDVEKMVALRQQEGFEEGYQEGLAEVTERLTALSRLEIDFLKDVEPKLMRLVYDICERMIGQELTQNRDALIDMVKQVLREIAGTQRIIRIHPSEYAVIKAHETELLQVMDATSTLTIREDERVKPGGCIIDSELGTIDAQLATQLAAIRKALNIE